MKSVFITYDQAHQDGVNDALRASLCRGYTMFPQVCGCGSTDGEPHLGSHAWPALNCAVITICEDDRVEPLLSRLKKLDQDNPMLGLRAFVWNIEQTLL